MPPFIFRRIAPAVLVLLVVGIGAFSLFQYVGDPVSNMVGQDATPAQRERLHASCCRRSRWPSTSWRSLADSDLPPAWLADGRATYPLGTDDQGRDILSALFYGARISLMVGLCSWALSVLVGVTAGLVAGFAGGVVDGLPMRLCDVMLSLPPILVALLIDGVGRLVFPQAHDVLAFAVLVFAMSVSDWVRYARTVRGSTLVERDKEYVQAARLIGVSCARLLRRHVLPNVLGPVLVLATLQVGQAIVTEATLSFLGVGVPPTHPSLGTLVRVGNDFLYAGEWWITVFTGAALVLIAMSVNLLGDWLRDALNPRLR